MVSTRSNDYETVDTDQTERNDRISDHSSERKTTANAEGDADGKAPAPKKQRKTEPSAKGCTTAGEDPKKKNRSSDTVGGLQLEYARSGRSACRRCGGAIEKGAPRVGVEAWISGRQALTWQHVPCFLAGLSCGYETTGRSKCSFTGQPIARGQVKLAARSHTAKRYYSMDVVDRVLSVVLSWVAKDELDEARACLTVEGMDGSKDLKKEDQEKLQSVLSKIERAPSSRGAMADQEDQAKDESMKTKAAAGQTPRKRAGRRWQTETGRGGSQGRQGGMGVCRRHLSGNLVAQPRDGIAVFCQNPQRQCQNPQQRKRLLVGR